MVAIESAAAALLLGGVIAAAQWLLRRLYHEPSGAYTEEDCSCHQPK